MKKYKGVILDLDGTLLDTLDDLGDSMNEALRMLDYPSFTMDEYKMKIGGGFRGLAVNCLPEDIGEESVSKLIKIFTEIYDKKYASKTKPYEEINGLLDELVSEGIALAINSNKRDAYTKNLAQKFFRNIPFIKVYGEREGVPTKPDPCAALEIAAAMGLHVEEVLFIGDTRVDIQTANKAGMDSIGVLWGFRNREELKSYGASYIVSKPKDILEIARTPRQGNQLRKVKL